MGTVSLWPVAASTQASKVDLLFVVLLAISGVIVLLVAGLLLGFSIRYRRGSSAPRGPLPAFLSRDIEIGWTSAHGVPGDVPVLVGGHSRTFGNAASRERA